MYLIPFALKWILTLFFFFLGVIPYLETASCKNNNNKYTIISVSLVLIAICKKLSYMSETFVWAKSRAQEYMYDDTVELSQCCWPFKQIMEEWRFKFLFKWASHKYLQNNITF